MFLLGSDLLVIHLHFIEQLAIQLVFAGSFARFVGLVWVSNEGRLDQGFLAFYLIGIIRIFMEEIGGSW